MALLQAQPAERQVLSAKVAAAGAGGDAVFIPFTCVGETWRTLTERRGHAIPPDAANLLIRRSLRSFPVLFPSVRMLNRSLRLAAQLAPRGAEIFDVQITAICLEHNIDEVWTYDRNFPAVPPLRVINPLN